VEKFAAIHEGGAAWKLSGNKASEPERALIAMGIFRAAAGDQNTCGVGASDALKKA